MPRERAQGKRKRREQRRAREAQRGLPAREANAGQGRRLPVALRVDSGDRALQALGIPGRWLEESDGHKVKPAGFSQTFCNHCLCMSSGARHGSSRHRSGNLAPRVPAACSESPERCVVGIGSRQDPAACRVKPQSDLTGLKYVIEVAEVGSFTQAGVRLRLNSSTLTRRISSIEDASGSPYLSGHDRASAILAVRGRHCANRRAIGELDPVTDVANRNGGGRAGEIRLRFRIPLSRELFLMLSPRGVCVTRRWR